jgi:hypothetical protein
MQSENIQSLFQDLLSADNTARKRAEDKLTEASTAEPTNLVGGLIQGMNSGNVQVAMLCLVMLKKYFLDPRAATQLEPAQLEQVREAIQASIEFVEQPIMLLKRKADVLSKVYWKLSKN